MSSVDPDVVRALVRRALEERLGPPPPGAPASPLPSMMRIHPSLFVIAEGVECTEDTDLPIRKPCLIEPHRPCYNSGYCRKLGH